MVYLPLSRPSRHSDWRAARDAAGAPSPTLMLHPRPNPVTLDGLSPVGRSRPLAPRSCVTTQECPAEGQVALVARDLEGRIRLRIELAREDVADGWWFRLLRWALALRYGAAEIRLLKEG